MMKSIRKDLFRIALVAFMIFGCFSELILVPQLYAVTDELVGTKAPMISGKNAAGRGLLNLKRIMTEVYYEKDEYGRFVEKGGKYVLKVKKNVVVLNFFATSCIPCIKEIPTFNQISKEYKDNPVKLIYINVDLKSSEIGIQSFINNKKIEVPMMLPNQREAIRRYNVYYLPRIVIIDREGIIVDVITGFDKNLHNTLQAKIDKLLDRM